MTLQLARITAARLADCRRSVETLSRLCSYDLAPASDHLDLDWAKHGIIRMCALSGVGDVSMVRRALEGGEAVNPAYRDHPDTVPEQPRFHRPAEVMLAAGALRDIDLDRGFAALPDDPEAVRHLLGGNLTDLIGDPRRYLVTHVTALRDFLTAAAHRRLAIVNWWD